MSFCLIFIVITLIFDILCIITTCMNVQVLNAPMIYGGLFASMAAGYYMYKNGMRKLNVEVSTGSLQKCCIGTTTRSYIDRSTE